MKKYYVEWRDDDQQENDVVEATTADEAMKKVTDEMDKRKEDWTIRETVTIFADEEKTKQLLTKEYNRDPDEPACTDPAGHDWEESQGRTGVPNYDTIVSWCEKCKLNKKIIGEEIPDGSAGDIFYSYAEEEGENQ